MDYRKLDDALCKTGGWRSEILFDGVDGDFYGFSVMFSQSHYFSLKLLEQKIELIVSKGIEEGWIAEEERLVCYDVSMLEGGNIKALFVAPSVAKIYDDLKSAIGVSDDLYDISMSRVSEGSRHGRYDVPAEELAVMFFLASLPTFYYPFKTFEGLYDLLWDSEYFRHHLQVGDQLEEIKKASPWLPNAQLMLAMTNLGSFTKTQSAGTLPASMFEEKFFWTVQADHEVLSRRITGRGIPVEFSSELGRVCGDIFPVWVVAVHVTGKYGDAEYSVEFSYVSDPWAAARRGLRKNQVSTGSSGLLGYKYRVVPEFDEDGYIYGASRIVASY